MIKIEDDVILIRPSKKYDREMNALELYEITRGVWRIGMRMFNADFVFCVVEGKVIEVYEIDTWVAAGTVPYETREKADVEILDRWEFIGKVAEKKIRSKYIGETVTHYLPKGAANPITYVNC